jgi:hypothetical protein
VSRRAEIAALLGWLLAETRDGSVLGLAERLTSSIQTCWPFIVAIALRRSGARTGALVRGTAPSRDGDQVRDGSGRHGERW